MKITKKQIEKIKNLKEKGKTMKEISKELNIPYSTIQYYYNPEYREKAIERSRKRLKEKGDTRDKKKYREYQRNYHSKKYKEDKEYKAKLKKLNRENQRK